jgi:hypothetical protein
MAISSLRATAASAAFFDFPPAADQALLEGPQGRIPSRGGCVARKRMARGPHDAWAPREAVMSGPTTYARIVASKAERVTLDLAGREVAVSNGSEVAVSNPSSRAG